MKKSRKTKQKELIEEIIKHSKSFFTAEDIYKLAKKTDKTIGIATVYRYIKFMKNNGLIRSYTCERRSLYSLNEISHCHYTCEKTGKVFHFELDSLDFLKKIKEKIPGSITSVQLEIKGVCEDCNS
jgi:Fur family transcriptional regulator, ferric uptake regulator